MKNHQFLALGACALALAAVPAAAQADKPADAAHQHADAKAAKPGDPPGKPADPGKPAKPGDAAGKPGDAAGKPGDAAGKPADKGALGAKGEPGKPDDAGKPGHGHRGHHNDGFRNAMRELHEELKAGTIKKEELKDKLAKLRETSGERGKLHRQELGKRWGAALAAPSAREELKHHARRMAFLDRAMLLAQTEVTKDKDKVIERITKLIDKENERHERAMERLKSGSGTPASSASPTASGAPAAASAAPAAKAAPAASAASDAKGAAK